MSREDMDLKELWQVVLKWFSQKNKPQRVIWVAYLFVFVYEFFITPTKYELFGFTILSLPVAFILDYLLGRAFNKKV